MELFDSVKTNLVPDTGNAFEMIERIKRACPICGLREISGSQASVD
jgi:hypothetical protein